MRRIYRSVTTLALLAACCDDAPANATRRSKTPACGCSAPKPTTVSHAPRRRARSCFRPIMAATRNTEPNGGISRAISRRRRGRHFGFELTFFRYALAPEHRT